MKVESSAVASHRAAEDGWFYFGWVEEIPLRKGVVWDGGCRAGGFGSRR